LIKSALRAVLWKYLFDTPYKGTQITALNPFFTLTTTTLAPSISNFTQNTCWPAPDYCSAWDSHPRRYYSVGENLAAFLDDT
jgi:hypothetical protein